MVLCNEKCYSQMVITRAIMKLFKFFRETLELKSFSSNAKLNDDITQNNLLKLSENTANLLTPSVYNIKEKTFSMQVAIGFNGLSGVNVH